MHFGAKLERHGFDETLIDFVRAEISSTLFRRIWPCQWSITATAGLSHRASGNRQDALWKPPSNTYLSNKDF